MKKFYELITLKEKLYKDYSFEDVNADLTHIIAEYSKDLKYNFFVVDLSEFAQFHNELSTATINKSLEELDIDNVVVVDKSIEDIITPGTVIKHFIKFIDRGISDVELKNYLTSLHYFDAPASTQYSYSYKGGLAEHSLNVYYNLCKLVDMYELKYSRETLMIVSLFHDLEKATLYDETIVNKKEYCEDGDKKDELGRFTWKSSKAYKVKEDRELFGDSGFASYMLLNRYIPLSDEEVLAIVHCKCDKGNEGHTRDITALMSECKLITLLHMADLASCYIENEQ